MDQDFEKPEVISDPPRIQKTKGIKWIAAFDLLIGSICFLISYLIYEEAFEIFGIALLTFGLLNYFGAIQLLRHKSLRLQFWISVIQVVFVPIGPLVSPWIFWYLRRPHVKHAFGLEALEVPPADLNRKPNRKLVRRLAVLTVLIPLVFLAVTVPKNLMLAMRRGGQKRNMANIRSIGTAVEAYGVDLDAYPPGHSTTAEIKKYLVPKYIKELPVTDSWKNPFMYYSNDVQSYTIISYGKDHKPDPIPFQGATVHFENDLIFSAGQFVTYSEGT